MNYDVKENEYAQNPFGLPKKDTGTGTDYDDTAVKADIAKNAKAIDDTKKLLASDDTTLDELQEVVEFVKANKTKLDAMTIANIAGLQDKLDELKTASDANKTDIDKLKTDLAKAVADIAKLKNLKAEIIDNDIAEPKLRWTDKEGVTHDYPISPVSDKSYWADGSFDIKHVHREKPIIMAKKMINIDLADIVDGDKFHFIIHESQGGFTAKNGNGMIINTLMDGQIAPMPDMMLPFTIFKQGSVVEMYFANDASGKLQGWIKEVRSIPTNMLVRVEHTNGLEGEGTIPSKLSVKLSTNANNMLRFGTDKGVFTPSGGHIFKNGNFDITGYMANFKAGDSLSVTIQDGLELQSTKNFTPIVDGKQTAQVKKLVVKEGDFVVLGMRGTTPTVSVFSHVASGGGTTPPTNKIHGTATLMNGNYNVGTDFLALEDGQIQHYIASKDLNLSYSGAGAFKTVKDGVLSGESTTVPVKKGDIIVVVKKGILYMVYFIHSASSAGGEQPKIDLRNAQTDLYMAVNKYKENVPFSMISKNYANMVATAGKTIIEVIGGYEQAPVTQRFLKRGDKVTGWHDGGKVYFTVEGRNTMSASTHMVKNAGFNIQDVTVDLINDGITTFTIQEDIQVASNKNFTPILNGVQSANVMTMNLKKGDFVVIGMNNNVHSVSVFRTESSAPEAILGDVGNVMAKSGNHYIVAKGKRVLIPSDAPESGHYTIFATGSGSGIDAIAQRAKNYVLKTPLGGTRANDNDQNLSVATGEMWHCSWYPMAGTTITEFTQLR